MHCWLPLVKLSVSRSVLFSCLAGNFALDFAVNVVDPFLMPIIQVHCCCLHCRRVAQTLICIVKCAVLILIKFCICENVRTCVFDSNRRPPSTPA